MFVVVALAACDTSPETTSDASASGTTPNRTTQSDSPSSDAVPPSVVRAPTPAPDVATTAETSDASSTTQPAGALCVETTKTWRTDLNQTGNRVGLGSVNFSADPVVIELSDVPEWILPWGDSSDWYVVLADGTAIVVSPDGTTKPASAPPDAEPPELTIGVDGRPEVRSAWADHDLFTNPLPDTRVVGSGDLVAALVDPTDRYDHGVLGDALEAGAVEILDRCTDERTRIEIAAPSVIEGIAPMFADIDGDGAPEVLITTSNEMVGARLEAWTTGGELIARTDAIDRGRRWRNQLGVASTNPDGGIEIVDVRTPHLAGVVEFFRLDGDRLIRSATLTDYTSHVLGSRNLDMGILVDVTGDDRPEVVVYNRQRQELAAITRSIDGAELATTQPLAGMGVTNISMQLHDGGASLAVGTSSELLYIWE